MKERKKEGRRDEMSIINVELKGTLQVNTRVYRTFSGK